MTIPSEAHRDYVSMRRTQHRHCVVCGCDTPWGLGLEFRRLGDGSVQAEFSCRRLWEGYCRVLHGGVVCAVLDGAMTNCLFAAGTAAVTGDLRVRFRKPVSAQGTATVEAWIESSTPPLYQVAARLRQAGEIKATAQAKFMEIPLPPSRNQESRAPRRDEEHEGQKTMKIEKG